MKKQRWNNNLKALREKHNLTQQQLAKIIGHKSNDLISHWEKGQMIPNLNNLIKLSITFNVSIHELY